MEDSVIIETHVIAVYSNNIGSLLLSRAEAEAYAEQAKGRYLRLGGYLADKPSSNKNPSLQIVGYTIEPFAHHPNLGRVLATCERSGWDSRREEKSA